MMDWFSKFLNLSPHATKEPAGPSIPSNDSRSHESFDDQFRTTLPETFGQLGSFMKEFENFFNGMGNEAPHTPRDSMLKEPDSSKLDPPAYHGGYQTPFSSNPESDNSNDYFDGPNSSFGFSGSFSDPFGGNMDPFSMMEEMMKSFGGIFHFSDQFPAFRGLPEGRLEDPNIYKEDSRMDKDLDDRYSEAPSLLKEGPGYSYRGDSHQLSPSTPSGVAPSVQHSYRSTSIVRVRKPDGTIEERRKYTDSSGREEETITTREPTGSQGGTQSPVDPSQFPLIGLNFSS